MALPPSFFTSRVDLDPSKDREWQEIYNPKQTELVRDAANNRFFSDQVSNAQKASTDFSSILGNINQKSTEGLNLTEKNANIDDFLGTLTTSFNDAKSYADDYSLDLSGYIPGSFNGQPGEINDHAIADSRLRGMTHDQLLDSFDLGLSIPSLLSSNPYNTYAQPSYAPQNSMRYMDKSGFVNSPEVQAYINKYGLSALSDLSIDDATTSQFEGTLAHLGTIRDARTQARATQAAGANTLNETLGGLSIDDWNTFDDYLSQISTGLDFANEYSFDDVADLFGTGRSTIDDLNTELGTRRTDLETSAAERLAEIQANPDFYSLDDINAALEAYEARANDVSKYGATAAEDELAGIKSILDDNFVRLDEERIIREQSEAARAAVAQAAYGQPNNIVNNSYNTGTDLGGFPNWVRVRNRQTGRMELVPANYLGGLV